MSAHEQLARAHRAHATLARARGEAPAPKPGEPGAAGMGPDDINEVIQLLDAGEIRKARELLLTYSVLAKPKPEDDPDASPGPGHAPDHINGAPQNARARVVPSARLRAEGFDPRFVSLYEQAAKSDPRNAEALLSGARARRAQSRP